MTTSQSSSEPKRRRTLPNIWQAVDKRDMHEFERHLKIMVANGTVSDAEPSGRTILHFVAMCRNDEMAKALILAGADTHARDNRGASATAEAMNPAYGPDGFGERFMSYITEHEAINLADSTPAARLAEKCKSGRL